MGDDMGDTMTKKSQGQVLRVVHTNSTYQKRYAMI